MLPKWGVGPAQPGLQASIGFQEAAQTTTMSIAFGDNMDHRHQHWGRATSLDISIASGVTTGLSPQAVCHHPCISSSASLQSTQMAPLLFLSPLSTTWLLILVALPTLDSEWASGHLPAACTTRWRQVGQETLNMTKIIYKNCASTTIMASKEIPRCPHRNRTQHLQQIHLILPGISSQHF